MSQVPSTRTPWELDELLGSLDRAYLAIVGSYVTVEGLAALAAQATLETGRGGKSCYNHNVSNIMGVSPEGTFHVLRSAPECAPRDKVPAGATILEHTNVACPPGSVAYLPPGGSRFRAYSTLELACEDKLAVLLSLWPRAVEALGRDTPVEATVASFVAGLKRPIAKADYFTSDAMSYARSTTSIAREYLDRARAQVGRRTMPSPLPTRTLDANVPVEGVVLEDFLATLADDEPKV